MSAYLLVDLFNEIGREIRVASSRFRSRTVVSQTGSQVR